MNAIEFDHVGKLYHLGTVGTGTLSHDLNRWWQTRILRKEDPYLKVGETNDRAHRGNSDFVWALRDITFDVKQGEVVGVIGKNGAGKSTLLKLLSRVTAPTTGEIRARGRIASLLEVGTGFHPEMTGRENIYMNGAIMGMTRAEITRKLDEIVDFAGVARYLDTPVKRYSSGMTVRLGFAVAAFLEPEILVVDEVLAVGDAEFQKKAIGKMKDVSQVGGHTVLFVSHNLNSVHILCQSGLVLKNGIVDLIGTADQCIDYYIGNNIVELVQYHKLSSGNHLIGNRQVEIIEAKLLCNPYECASDDDIGVELLLKKNFGSYKVAQYSVFIYDEADVRIETFFSNPIEIPQDKDEYIVRLKMRELGLFRGRYKLRFSVGQRDYSSYVMNFDATTDVLSFEIKYLKRNPLVEYASDSQWFRGIHRGGKYIECEVE